MLQLKEAERSFNLKKIQNLQNERLQREKSLQRSTYIFKSIVSKSNDVKLTEKNQACWENLFERDRIRDALMSPQSVRDLIAFVEIESRKFEDENLNWWLQCDEFSLLTQMSVPDSRRSVMKAKFIEKEEKFFKTKIETLLEINDRLAAKIEDGIVSNNISAELQEFIQVIISI